MSWKDRRGGCKCDGGDVYYKMMTATIQRAGSNVLNHHLSTVAVQAQAQEIANSVSELPIGDTTLKLVDEICRLNLIEASQVVSLLKKRLNLPDTPSSIPILSIENSAMGGNSAAKNAEASKPVEEKTQFKVILEKFDTAAKAKIIREVKTIMPQMNLVEAKAFVEGAPKVLKENIKKDEAEKLKKTLEDLGATIAIE